jgi:hypothetical protein
MGLSGKEIQVLKLIDKNTRDNRKNSSVTAYLRNNLGLPRNIVNKIYPLWLLNHREDGKYEEIEEVNRETQPILHYLKKIQEDEMYDDEIPERFFGELNLCKGTYGRYASSSWNTPCISIDADNVTFRLGNDIGEYTEITGLYEDDIWVYQEAMSNYRDYYEEFDDEEFDYIPLTKEVMEKVKEIAIITDNKNALKYINTNNSPDSERIVRFLREMMPESALQSIIDDYISTIGYMTGDARRRAVNSYYNENVEYPIDNSDDNAIEIPIEKVIEYVEDNVVLTIDDLASIEYQSSLNMVDTWYDTGYWDIESSDHIDELVTNLTDWIDSNDEGVYDEYIKNKSIIDNIIKQTNLEKKYGSIYQSKDHRLSFDYVYGIDFVNKKIKFSYDGQTHIVPFENFSDWAQGSVLDLNESVRYGRVLIMEEKQTINKISIFDFDGTLADTPNKEDGITLWEAKNNKDYPHRGWWGREESLDENTFNVKLIPSTMDDYNKESEGNNTLMVMLTGRLPKLSNQVESILNKNGVIFDEYHYKGRGDTFTSKLYTIKSLLENNPNVTEIEMWEDRLNHADGFEEWGNDNGIDIKVNRVTI